MAPKSPLSIPRGGLPVLLTTAPPWALESAVASERTASLFAPPNERIADNNPPRESALLSCSAVLLLCDVGDVDTADTAGGGGGGGACGVVPPAMLLRGDEGGGGGIVVDVDFVFPLDEGERAGDSSPDLARVCRAEGEVEGDPSVDFDNPEEGAGGGCLLPAREGPREGGGGGGGGGVASRDAITVTDETTEADDKGGDG